MIKTQNVVAAIAQLHAGLQALAVALEAKESEKRVGPIEAVRYFRAANPNATPRDAIAELKPKGYNPNTIRTQMSRQARNLKSGARV